MSCSLVSLTVRTPQGRCLVPWSVIPVEPTDSFIDLLTSITAGKYGTILPTSLQSPPHIESVHVGKDKTSLSLVDKNMNVIEVCQTFGSFIKIVNGLSELAPVQTVNAFDILMSSQRKQCSRSLPEYIPEKNKKDKLFNDLIRFLKDIGLKWPNGELQSGRSFLVTLANVLWYIDGHYESLANRGCKVPNLFEQFTGYNRPELSKHRKRALSNLNSDTLAMHVSSLYDALLLSWLNTEKWQEIKTATHALTKSLDDYVKYLRSQCKKMNLHHCGQNVSVADKTSLKVLNLNLTPSRVLCKLNDDIMGKEMYEMLCVDEYAPADRKKRYMFIQDLYEGLSKRCVVCTFSVGGPLGTYHFLWPIPHDVSLETSLAENQKNIAEIQASAPTYHRRALRRHLVSQFGRISGVSNLASLRELYRQATNDCSASLTTAEEELDARLQEALEMEDPSLVIDLRENNGRTTDKFKVFWECMEKYLNNESAVHERRHGSVTFMAKAISVRDLIQEVAKLCPDDPVPSEQWVRLQFFPKNPRAKTASQYRSRFKVKMVVQKRQFRFSHPDSHYCAAIFRYMREYAVLHREISSFISLDDKHRVKVGEPGNPVAAVERGRRVLVNGQDTFAVSDHDFCKFSIVPSVSFEIDIPENLDESWYRGTVHVGYKDAVHEPSSPIRHVTELFSILRAESTEFKPVMFIYTDGGPDHRLTYLSVQLSMIALFRQMNLDLLVVGRTAPCNSWKNPVERIMSIVNLGLQSVGIVRREGSVDFERAIKYAKNLSQLREATGQLKQDVKDSLSPPIELLCHITERLELKGKKFQVFDSATSDEISDFWEILRFIDASLQPTDTTKRILSPRPHLQDFMDHCCQIHHYSFCIKKCGSKDCSICLPLRLDTKVFESLKFLPDPVLGSDGHYLSFDEVFITKTTEKDRPSLKGSKHKKSLSYSPTKQHATNVNVVIQCDECDKWRLLFSKRKLLPQQRTELRLLLSDLSYTCGSRFSELDLPQSLECVEVREHQCSDGIEKLYYTAYPNDVLCIHCGSVENISEYEEGTYPICNNCTSMGRVYKRGSSPSS